MVTELKILVTTLCQNMLVSNFARFLGETNVDQV
jgi:hypothetical protein